MADLDTREKRASGIHVGLPWRGLLPLPDGTVGQADRQHTATLYGGVLAGAAVPSYRSTYAMRLRRLRILEHSLGCLLVAFALTFDPGQGCKPVSAAVDFIQPEVAKILYVEECGAIRCWSQWLVVDGKRAGHSRVCQNPRESGGLELAPLPGAGR